MVFRIRNEKSLGRVLHLVVKGRLGYDDKERVEALFHAVKGCNHLKTIEFEERTNIFCYRIIKQLVNELSRYCSELNTFVCPTGWDISDAKYNTYLKTDASDLFEACKAINTINIKNVSRALSHQFKRHEFETKN